MTKGITGLVLGTLLTVTTAAKGQTLDCGYATLHLGEAEAEAVEQLNGVGYKNFAAVDASQLKTFQTFLGPGERPSHPTAPTDVCEVEFVKHKITYVVRHWTKNVKNELDAVHNVVEALHAIAPAAERASCEMFTFDQSSPEYQSKSVKISCGSHTVIILSGKTKGEPTYDIAESIGNM